MEKHPNSFELKRIHLVQRILTGIALATVVLIAIVAVHGNFKKPRTPPQAAEQQQR
jgi:hypothetical protein